MHLISCKSRYCKVARRCATASINRPNPRVRNQRIKEYEPKLEKDCPGFKDLGTEYGT